MRIEYDGPKSHKGLLGLDILKKYGFIVDMDTLELCSTSFHGSQRKRGYGG